MGRFSQDPYTRQALMDALSQFGSRLSAGAATEGWGALGPAVNEGWQRAHISREEARKRELEEEKAKRQAANDAFREAISQRNADLAERRLGATEAGQLKLQEDREADNKRADAAARALEEERRLDREARDRQFGLSQSAAFRSERSLAATESRFEQSETRRERERREDAERAQRSEARVEADRRQQEARFQYSEGLIDKLPAFEDIFDEELVIRGLPPVRKKAEPTGSPTPRTAAPAGAPAPPKETPRVPARRLGSVGASAETPRAPAAKAAGVQPMPSSVSSLVGSNAAAAKKAAELHAGGMSWGEIERLLREARGGR